MSLLRTQYQKRYSTSLDVAERKWMYCVGDNRFNYTHAVDKGKREVK
ncbi:hypothetical protein SAMN05428961_11569 [Paenibacillus sp. OK060]|nr:hypothetical protein [Paenibacillus sp. OK060]SDM37092.1 hypothetical protein SAMN05428961_11569 [Paenibacillus sp. OK060]